jgi:uncharacterized protein
MRERAWAVAALFFLAAWAAAADPRLPALRGFVTDEAGVLSPEEEGRLTARIRALRERTGAEIAVVTVPTTAPLDDFTYAMRLADAWRPGRREDDTGLVLLLATEDRRLRVLTGYGLEGVLPDGAVGAIQDAVMVPALRAGRPGVALVRGVDALAERIERGLARGAEPAVPPPRRGVPAWVILLVVLVTIAFLMYEARSQTGFVRGRRRRGIFLPGGFAGGRWPGGFGGGGGGFGGFGGGRFGGGGAGRSW